MDKNFPLVSIIIPTYNIAAYIERAIRSALNQSYPNIEVIMVDDQSSDHTVAIARAINDPRLTIIEQAQNGGPSAARNKGFESAKGEWIAILDGDDDYLEDRLSMLIATAKNTNADIVVDNLIVAPENGAAQSKMFSSTDFKASHTIDLAKFIRGNQLFLGGYTLGYLKPVFRSLFLKQHHLSYSTDIRIGEDYLLMAECLAKGAKCVTVPYAGYLYTVRSGSISHRLNEDAVNRIEAADRLFTSKYVMTGPALAAQQGRTRKLHLALAFTQLIEALKGENLKGATRIALKHPLCLPYLWRPIWAKIKRICRI